MRWNIRHLAAALLPICFLSAQQPDPRQPNPRLLRRASEERRILAEHANAINYLAANIHSLDDARKLVDLVAAEFSDGLPRKLASRSMRNRIAHAEYESAYDPGALIPERHIADAWNDYLQKIGAPQDSYITADEIHYLRDSYYTSSQFFWVRGNQTVFTVYNIYAIGPNGKVANGCRAVETLNVLWKLGTDPELLEGTRKQMKSGPLLSDMIKNPLKPPVPGSEKGRVTLRARMLPDNPIEQAAFQYTRIHGTRALNTAIEDLLKDLFPG